MNATPSQGYLALPTSGQGPGVLVLHPWWGLNATIKDVCDRLAGEGFVAFAPDLYHGEIAETIEEAEQLSSQLDEERAERDLTEAVALLSERAAQEDELAVIGFSLGAFYALDLAAKQSELVCAVVLFYGTGGGDHQKSRAAYLGHFAHPDEYEPAEYVDGLEAALKAAGRPVTFYRYEGLGHWFFEADREEAYNQPAAQLAWERTVTFLKNTLSSP